MRRPRRAALSAALLLAAIGGGARQAEAQQRPPARFFVGSVGDSTFTIAVPSDPWVRPGLHGIVVDPERRDSLVARFAVTRVDWGTATAMITGQTTRVTTSHVALLELPPVPWYRRRAFWLGLLLGGGAGAGAMALSR